MYQAMYPRLPGNQRNNVTLLKQYVEKCRDKLLGMVNGLENNCKVRYLLQFCSECPNENSQMNKTLQL